MFLLQIAEGCSSRAYFFRLLSETIHSTSSRRQLVQGICSTTLQRTFLARQHWQAFDARLFTLLFCCAVFTGSPAWSTLRLTAVEAMLDGARESSCDSWLDEVSDMIV